MHDCDCSKPSAKEFFEGIGQSAEQKFSNTKVTLIEDEDENDKFCLLKQEIDLQDEEDAPKIHLVTRWYANLFDSKLPDPDDPEQPDGFLLKCKGTVDYKGNSWSFQFTADLTATVGNRLKDFDTFIDKTAAQGLTNKQTKELIKAISRMFSFTVETIKLATSE